MSIKVDEDWLFKEIMSWGYSTVGDLCDGIPYRSIDLLSKHLSEVLTLKFTNAIETQVVKLTNVKGVLNCTFLLNRLSRDLVDRICKCDTYLIGRLSDSEEDSIFSNDSFSMLRDVNNICVSRNTLKDVDFMVLTENEILSKPIDFFIGKNILHKVSSYLERTEDNSIHHTK